MLIALFLFWAATGGLIFGPDSHFYLEQSKDDFGVRSHGVIEQFASGRTKFYPLPQSSAEDYKRLRPYDFRINPFDPAHYTRQEAIGPYQVEDRKLWFGKQYYDSEGMRGVGAFGYFDTANRAYTLFSPPEVARFEIGVILVQPDCVWIGLDRFGEDISKSPGGLVRWDRKTRRIEAHPLEFVIDSIRVDGDSLRLETREGYAHFREGALRRFLRDGTPVAKYPDPPTIH